MGASPLPCAFPRTEKCAHRAVSACLAAVWVPEANEGGCSAELWLELARLRENDHPEDAARIYLARVEPLVSQKNNQAYADAVALLRKTRELMIRLGQRQAFDDQLTAIRATHKPKRNFIQLLDTAGL